MDIQPAEFAQALALCFVIVSLFSTAWLFRRVVSLLREVEVLRRDRAEIDASLCRIASNAAALKERRAENDQRFRSFDLRINRIEQRDLDGRRYTEAVRLVQRGAGAENLVANCGLTTGEADLVARLHGLRLPA